jgi:hypothetical protein
MKFFDPACGCGNFLMIAYRELRLLELEILQKIADSGDEGLTRQEAAEQTGVSLYGVGVLAEMALGMGVLKLSAGAAGDSAGEERFVLGKTGWFLLEDPMTRININFINDLCYRGAFNLIESIRTGKPRGLDEFQKPGRTIYEILASLDPDIQKSWFDFDHFYSDIAFPEALPVVFANKPRHILDLGGNTAKWAISCCKYDPDVRVTIADLPGQTARAQKNAAAAGFGERIAVHPCDMLDPATVLPAGADAVWMSQFLDCFSLEEITGILGKIRPAVEAMADIYVLEPLWDQQRFEASAYTLRAVSLYFTCIANGNSKMYRYQELTGAVERAGFELKTAHHDLGIHSYSLLRFRKTP